MRVVLLYLLAACGKDASTPPPQPQAAERDREHALVREALAAKGAKLAEVKAIKWVSAGTFGPDKISNTRVLVRPDKMRSDTVMTSVKFGAFQNTNIMDGASAWKRTRPPGEAETVTEVTEKALEEFQQDLWLDPDFLLLHANEPSAVLSPAPNVGLLPCANLAGRGLSVTMCFDPKTKLLVRLAYTQRGEPLVIEMADFRDVAGIKFGFHRKITDPADVIEVTYSSIEVDPTIEASYFTLN